MIVREKPMTGLASLMIDQENPMTGLASLMTVREYLTIASPFFRSA